MAIGIFELGFDSKIESNVILGRRRSGQIGEQIKLGRQVESIHVVLDEPVDEHEGIACYDFEFDAFW